MFILKKKFVFVLRVYDFPVSHCDWIPSDDIVFVQFFIKYGDSFEPILEPIPTEIYSKTECKLSNFVRRKNRKSIFSILRKIVCGFLKFTLSGDDF